MAGFMFLRKRLFWLGAVVAILIGGIYIFSTTTGQKEVLQTVQVKKADVKDEISTSGTLTGKNTTNLKFRSSGKLAFINVNVGDKVSTGRSLAGLDTQDLGIKLQQAQNTLRDKQAQLDKIYDDLKGHDADETYSQRQTRTTAQVARDNAFDAVREAKRAFQDAAIVAPYNGVITAVNVVPGQSVSASDIVTTISDNTSLFFDAEVDEADIGKLTLGQEVEVTLDSFPASTFAGEVSEIAGTTKVTSTNATIVLVRVSLSTKPERFISGLNGQASIIIKKAEGVLTVPVEALRQDNTVLVISRKGLEVRQVEVGIRSGEEVEIKKGLEEGEKVVASPATAPSGRTSPLGGVFRLFGGHRPPSSR